MNFLNWLQQIGKEIYILFPIYHDELKLDYAMEKLEQIEQ